MSQWQHMYANRRWRARRARQLAEHPLCAICQIFGRVTAATVADHIKPHRGDPVKFEGPLQSLCATCHSGLKKELEDTGRFRGCDENGIPYDLTRRERADEKKP